MCGTIDALLDTVEARAREIGRMAPRRQTALMREALGDIPPSADFLLTQALPKAKAGNLDALALMVCFGREEARAEECLYEALRAYIERTPAAKEEAAQHGLRLLVEEMLEEEVAAGRARREVDPDTGAVSYVATGAAP